MLRSAGGGALQYYGRHDGSGCLANGKRPEMDLVSLRPAQRAGAALPNWTCRPSVLLANGSSWGGAVGGQSRCHKPACGERGVTMRVGRLLHVVVLTAALAMVLGGPVGAQGRPFSTTLTGSAEVPGPGDPDASGTAFLTLNQGQGEVCFSLTWAGIDGTVVAAHIHAAPAGIAGPIVVPLFTGVALAGTDSASGCVTGVS